MDITQETYKLLGQRLLGTFDSKEYVDWAVKLLSSGQETESLVILAGMDNDSTEDREKYFWKAVSELKIDANKTDYELIDNYALKLADQVINKQVTPRVGLSTMLEIVRRTDYDQKYIQFYEIDEDIDYVFYSGTPLFNQGLTKDNIDDYIIKEFKLLIELSKINFDNSIYDKAFCNSCGQVVKPFLKTKYQLKRPFSYLLPTCPNCKSMDLNDFRTQIGREKIIRDKQTAPNSSYNQWLVDE